MGRACGKVILLGEHAVVYGVPAIAAGIDRGASATAVAATASRLLIPEWGIDVAEDEGTSRGQELAHLAHAFHALLETTRHGKASPSHFVVEARADLPPGGGLGCSAALGVAIARAIDPSSSDAVVIDRAMAWERIFHGNPSGIDASVAASGGCVLFEKALGLQPISVRGGLTLCVGSSGVASSTKTMVESVARLRERRPEVVAKTFEGIHVLVRNARLAIEEKDHYALGRLMDLNQMLLSGLFLSTPEIEQLCSLARGAGAHGAKLTGAGGGGSVVALVPGEAGAAKVLDAWKTAGFDGFAARVSGVEAPAVSQISP